MGDFFKGLFATELRFKPGEKYEYSNMGYSILARVIELASIDKVSTLLKINATIFPEDGDLWDSLGEANFEKARYKLAKESFEKAFGFKPKENCYWCVNSVNKLEKMKTKLQ